MNRSGLRDLAGISGIAAIGVGCGLYDYRAGIIAGGLLLLAISLAGMLNARSAPGS